MGQAIQGKLYSVRSLLVHTTGIKRKEVKEKKKNTLYSKAVGAKFYVTKVQYTRKKCPTEDLHFEDFIPTF